MRVSMSAVAALAVTGLVFGQSPVPRPMAPTCPASCPAPVNRDADVLIEAEATIVRLTSECLASLELFADDGQPGQQCFLTDCQARKLLDKVKGQRGCDVLAAPRVTTQDGQTAQVQIGGQQSFVRAVRLSLCDGQIKVEPEHQQVDCGLGLQLTPRLSADHRFVQLAVGVEQSQPNMDRVVARRVVIDDDELTLQQPCVEQRQMQTVVAIPCGQSMFLTLGEPSGQEECVQSKIPYIARLFQNHDSSCRLCLLVTPRVVAHEPCQVVARPAPMPPMVLPAPVMPEFVMPPMKVAQPLPQVIMQTRAEVPAPSADLDKAMRKYQKACKNGDSDKAYKWASRCLEIDPMCFSRDR